jgi:predicted RNase H-like HicB family nuclease
MKAKAKRRRAVFERDADGWWVASVPSVAGCHTQGQTLAQARERLKEALAVSVEGENLPELAEQVRLPRKVDLILTSFRTTRANAETALARANEVTRRAAVVLTGQWGVSLRDAADLLGLSHQRVAQLLEAERARSTDAARRARP